MSQPTHPTKDPSLTTQSQLDQASRWRAPVQDSLFPTPPIQTHDKFPASTSPHAKKDARDPPSLGPSPPITPDTVVSATFDGEYTGADVVLFPLNRETSEELQQEQTPLFAQTGLSPSFATQTILTKAQSPLHVSTSTHLHNTVPTRLPSPPFASVASHTTPIRALPPSPLYLRIPGTTIHIPNRRYAVMNYINSNCDQLRRMGRQALPPPAPSDVVERDALSRRQIRALDRPFKVAKRASSRQTPQVTPKLRTARLATASPKLDVAQLKRTPRTSAAKVSTSQLSPRDIPVPKHKRAAPSKKVDSKAADREWRELPDYCPPSDPKTSSKGALPYEWQYDARDISHEEDVEYLTAAEYDIASGLRLLPQQYLANKRRIFQACVEAFKAGKTFTRTAAQLACNIDVNKASRIWNAFKAVGWLERDHFLQYLD